MDLIDYRNFGEKLPFFRGATGRRLAQFFIRILAIDRVNRLYDHSCALSGAAFASGLLDDLGLDYLIGNAERLTELTEGAFITVSNHPYGGLDGIIMIDLMGTIRPEYRFMVNRFLSILKAMNSSFISVDPVTDKKTGITSESLRGIRETLSHLRNGHPAGFFPSGAVSDFSLRDLYIRDRQWQDSILHLIHSAKVPIVPVRFFGRNSAFFYFLGFIHWKIRSLRLPYEVFNKKGHKVRLGIGKIISVEEQSRFRDYQTLGSFLRKTVYEMEEPPVYITRKEFSKSFDRLELPGGRFTL